MNICHIGTKIVGGELVGIKRKDRCQHVYTVGKTGTGKSTLLWNLLVQDIEAGEGVCLIDPHGDMAKKLLDYIPPSRTRDVIYFNPADSEYPIAFNPFNNVGRDRIPLVASSLVGAFKNIWYDSWGPRMEYILYATVGALLEVENTSILGINRMLRDDLYRREIVKRVKNPEIRAFWNEEFENYDRKFQREIVMPIQNKIGQLVMSPTIRNIMGQVKSNIDPREIMDGGKILIVNLSKGEIGADKANLLGSLLVSAFQNSAMERATVPEEERRPFFLFADEFQNFVTHSFAEILSEARKYAFGIVIANQFTSQLDEGLREAVFGNVGSIVAFRIGNTDAEIIDREFGNAYSANALTELSNFHVCIKMLEEGEFRQPFMAKSLPPSGTFHGRGAGILRRSREQRGTQRQVVEERILKWTGAIEK